MIANLTLDQLRVLVAISDAGSFSAAGRSLRRVGRATPESVLLAGNRVSVAVGGEECAGTGAPGPATPSAA